MSNVETLIIGGDLDFATPPQITTKELLPYLPNGHQIVLPGIGHSLSFWTQQPEAGTRLVNTFLDSGKVDDSLYTPQSVDFTPTISHGLIAKIALGVMLALAVLTVFSLLWIARRAHKRGPFGRKASDPRSLTVVSAWRMVHQRLSHYDDDARSATSCSRLSRLACQSG
jgi:hypothetical protein